MGFCLYDGRFLAGFGFLGFMLAAAGCQSGDSTSILALTSANSTPKTAPEGKVLQASCAPIARR